MAKWVKREAWGNYKDPLQNHKFDGQLITVEKDGNKEIIVCNKLGNLFHEAKWYFGKHIGSKKISNIKSVVKRVNNRNAILKKITKQIKKNQEIEASTVTSE